VSTPEAGIDVGGTCVTASDVTEAIAWLEANMGTRFTFTQGMKGSTGQRLLAWMGTGVPRAAIWGVKPSWVSSWPVPIRTRLAHPYCRTL
jgi:hypothetical protein